METATATENKKLTIQEKRNQLRQLSAAAKEIQKASGEELTINQIIIDAFYTDEKNQIFKSFKGWIKEGYSVKKGEKAFFIWGRPRQENKEGEVKPVIENDDDSSTFFPISYIFSNAQVEPLKKQNNA